MATYGQLIEFGPYFSGGSLCTAKIYHYISGTTTLKDVYLDREKGSTAAQPLVSDSNGVAYCYADGLYKFRIDVSTDGVNYSTLYTQDKWAVVDSSLSISGEGVAITSASTLTLGTDGDFFHVTGSTGPITALSGTQTRVTLVFDGTPTLTHSGNLILLNANNFTATVNSVLVFVNEGAGIWREESRNAQADSAFRVVGSADATKQVALEVDGLTTATTRTHFVTDEDANDGQTWEVQNLTLVASVAANALTVAVKTKNGTDPSATDPIILKFRNATAGTGDYATVSLTAALSLVLSSGSTVGTVSGSAHRLYVGVANDAGTLRLFLYNPLVAATLSLTGIIDDQVYSSTAEGGAGGADTAQVLYSGTAFTSKAVRVIGYLESTQATAGTWVTAVSRMQLMGPGVKRTGDIVQVAYTQTGAVATGTTNTIDDDSIPQNTEGDEYMTKAITPRHAVNLLAIEHRGSYSTTSGSNYGIALFQDSVADALASIYFNLAANTPESHSLGHVQSAGSVSAITFKIRAGGQSGGTTTFNGIGSARRHGGVIASSLKITEIML